jgi:hypothetical protein
VSRFLTASDLERVNTYDSHKATNKCWGGKTKEFRSVQWCLCNHATWYLLGCCRLLLYGFTAVPDESELSLLLQPKVANLLCCFYFFQAARETAGPGGAVVWPKDDHPENSG